MPTVEVDVHVDPNGMRELFWSACESYTPTIHGARLEVEGGITEVSTKNLDQVIRIFGKPFRVEFGPKYSVLFTFGTPAKITARYLATGFSWGYVGSGPNGLANALVLSEFGQYEDLRKHIVKFDAVIDGPCLFMEISRTN